MEDPVWIRHDQETGLAAQWKLMKKKEEFKRSTANSFGQAFALKVGDVSDVTFGKGGEISFFKLLELKVDPADLTAQVEEGRNVISNEARRELMRRLLSLISEKNAIDLTAFNDEAIR